jgi:hypothetical protein
VLTAIDSADARAVATECLECDTADDVEGLVRERFGKLWPQLFPARSLPAPNPS